ncbi:F-box protein [Spatholobus suberectus]|nr:F-box protein [Spatholobus suberectus]
MANNENDAYSFTDFHEDIQVCILLYLGPLEIATLACTSKRLESLCTNDSKLWLSMCERRSVTYGVTKISFLWMSLFEEGHVVSFLDLDGRPEAQNNKLVALNNVSASFFFLFFFTLFEELEKFVVDSYK